ncbi:MAG TPA: hypothetical protein VFK57_18940 [Vicinamibacterales bacterium]|nr:hypothetical protein [Vicinamibacterales bacterium]
MPSLDDILKDTLIKIAGQNAPTALKEFEPGPTALSPRPQPQANGPVTQPVWVWDYTGVREIQQQMDMNHVSELEVWSRTMTAMHGNDVDMGWMSVARAIDWGPLQINLPGDPALALPLKQKYFVRGFTIGSGVNSGANPWWPLPAELDQSFMSVFAYDLTTRQQGQAPGTVPAAIYNSATFMPAPGAESTELPIGSTRDDAPVADRHFVCVVLSLVCMREKADFEPFGIIGMGRFYPHFMIMSNKRIAGKGLGVDATITVTRPDRSGYHGTWRNPGGAPRIMNHPDMDPPIKALLMTEPNVLRGVDANNLLPAPYWDLVFDYYLPIDYSGGQKGEVPRNTFTTVVDPGQTAERIVASAVRHLDYSKFYKAASTWLNNPALPKAIAAASKVIDVLLARPSLQGVMINGFANAVHTTAIKTANFLPRKPVTVRKLPGQGTFDNVHIAPGMKAHVVLADPRMATPPADQSWQAARDTLDKIRMAPFCEHDCLHTHWRWGSVFDPTPNSATLKGFAPDADARFTGTGKPYQTVGNPMVPRNQTVKVAFGKNEQLVYLAQIANIASGVWQPVYHHGSAYVLGLTAAGDPAFKGAKVALAGVAESSELYWNLRYQATLDGPLERVELTSAELQRVMTASRTIRLHLKVFEEPALATIEQMLVNAKALFALHHIDVVEMSRETMAAESPDFSRFQTLAIDAGVPTDAQTDLFNLRGDAEPDDIVIYFVRTLVPAQAGCPVHPPDRPGAIVCASLAGEWTLAHQLGHVLGLSHVNDDDRLMTARSTASIEAGIPAIVEDEVATMMASPFNQT